MNIKIAIIILGGDSYYRQPLALRLFFSNEASRIFIIGEESFYFENCDIDLVNKIKFFKGKKIFDIEYKNSKNTMEDVINIIKIIEKYKFDKYLLVTSRYHLKRVVYLINKLVHKNYLPKIEFKVTTQEKSFFKKILEPIKFFYYKILALKYEI